MLPSPQTPILQLLIFLSHFTSASRSETKTFFLRLNKINDENFYKKVLFNDCQMMKRIDHLYTEELRVLLGSILRNKTRVKTSNFLSLSLSL